MMDELTQEILNARQDMITELRNDNAKLQQENEQLKVNLQDLHLHTLSMENGEIDMSVSGESARLFFAMLVQTFKQNGGKNFLCQAVELGNCNERYSITIQNCNGTLTPAEKLDMYKQENDKLKEALQNLLYSCPEDDIVSWDPNSECGVKYNMAQIQAERLL